MKNIGLFIITVFTCLSLSGQRNVINRCQVCETLKGFPEDCSSFSKYVNKNSGITYYLSNDDKYLYLCLQTSDEMMQMKLIRVGMTLEFQIQKKTEKPAKLIFPADSHKSQGAGLRPGQMPDINALKKAYLSRTNQFFAEGFEKTNGQLTLKKTDGLAAKISGDSLSLYYQIIIPVSELFGEDYSHVNLSRMEISMIATIEAFERPQIDRPKDGMPPSTGRMPGDGVSRPGGMYRPSTGNSQFPQPDTQMNLLFREQRIKQSFRLSQGK